MQAHKEGTRVQWEDAAFYFFKHCMGFSHLIFILSNPFLPIRIWGKCSQSNLGFCG